LSLLVSPDELFYPNCRTEERFERTAVMRIDLHSCMNKEEIPETVERLDFESTTDAAQVFLHKQRYDFALERISPEDTVLEIGTGSGYFSQILASHCRSYTGLELDPHSVQRLRKQLDGRGTVVEGDAQASPLKDACCSCVVILEVLEHLPDYRKGIQEIHRCLKPGGKVIVSVPYRRRGGTSDTNRFHLYEPGEQELVQEFQKYFGKVEVQYQYFQETPLMTIARTFHFRPFVGLAGIYSDLWRGVPSAIQKVKIDSEGKGMRITLMLVASEGKTALK
jgi:ubiquinone/menaquinone biosynthesis C-methylase UbiE